MGNLFEQKYPNNIRIISGLNNIPFQDDSIIECDTTLGAVSINLLDIPVSDGFGYWSTQYKLYIVDKGNNAGVNNITVNAPVGTKINGGSSFIISSNGASLLVRVASNNNYVGQYSVTVGGTGNGHIIADEGVNLPQQPILDFVGAGVTVTNGVGKTVVTISNQSLVSLTNAQMQTLISMNSVVVGQFYLITDAGFTDLGVIVQGTLTNAVSVGGNGIFLNADYQSLGDYSGVVGFVSALGLWSSLVQPVVIGDCVVWNNLNYKNLTGAWGTAPNTDAVNWVLLPKNATNGYILAVDVVKYNVSTGVIMYRADSLENEVDLAVIGLDNSILNFQWGRGLSCYGNKVLSGSMMNCTNSYAVINSNLLFGGGIISDATSKKDFGIIRLNVIESTARLVLGETKGIVAKNHIYQTSDAFLSEIIAPNVALGGELRNNRVVNGASISVNVLNGTIDSNNLESRGQIILDVISGQILKNNLSNIGVLSVMLSAIGQDVIGCEVSDGIVVALGNITSSFINKKVRTGYSNWEANIDWSDPLIYNGGTLEVTIPVSLAYVGIFLCDNPSLMQRIFNAPTNHQFIFRPTSGTLRINSPIASVGVAVLGDIIANEFTIINAPFYNAVYRVNGCDEFGFKTLGNLVGWNVRNIWQ